LAGGHNVVRNAKAHGISEKMTDRAPRSLDRSLVVAGGIEPRAVHASDGAIQSRDGGDYCRPGLNRRKTIRAIIAARMKTKAFDAARVRNLASAKVRLGNCAQDRLGRGKQAPCRFR